MPQVPYAPYPTAQPSSQGVGPVNVNAPGEAFGTGVAQAIQGLGGAVEHVGDELWQRAIALQHLQNEAEANEADAQYMIDAGKLHTQFSSLKGKAAYDAFPRYQEDLDSLRKKIRGNLSSDMSRKMYDRNSLSTMGRTIFNGAGHAATEQKNYIVGASNARVNMAVNDVYNNPNNDVGYARTLREIRGDVELEANVKGWSEEQIQEETKKRSSTALALRITGLARTEPFKAKEMLEKNRALLYGGDAEKVERQVQSRLTTVGARNIEDKINGDLKGQTDPEKTNDLQARQQRAREEADRIAPDDPLFRDAVVQRVTSGYEQHAKAVRDDNEKNRFIVTNGIMGLNSPNGKLPTTVEELTADPQTELAFNRLTPSQQKQVRSALAKNAREDVIETPERRRRYEELLGMRLTSPSEFLDKDMSSEDIPQRWKTALFKQQLEVKKGVEGDPRVGQAMRQLEPVLRPLGINMTDGKEQYFQFKGALALAIEDWRAEHKASPKPEEIREIGNRLLQQQSTPGAIFGDRWPNKTPLYELSIPDNVAGAVKAEAKNRGLPEPSDEQIRQEYVLRRYRELYQGKPKTAPQQPQVPISR